MQAIFHNIRSMHNVGSMFRTAEGAGIEKIYLTGYTPAPVDELGRPRQKIAKVSLGTEQIIPWERVPSVGLLLKHLKRQKYVLFAIEQHTDSKIIGNFQVSKKTLSKTVLLMGNEVRGLSKPILAKIDTIVEIPMFGTKESLNVSVAFGIAAYYLKLTAK